MCIRDRQSLHGRACFTTAAEYAEIGNALNTYNDCAHVRMPFFIISMDTGSFILMVLFCLYGIFYDMCETPTPADKLGQASERRNDGFHRTVEPRISEMMYFWTTATFNEGFRVGGMETFKTVKAAPGA